jgi:hypothetical protein
MTRKLEELFDLPNDDKNDHISNAEPSNDVETNLPIVPETLAALDKIEAALPAVRGLEASDSEMDELADKAKKEFDNLMDLGMNVDSRYASEIFAVASQMLGHAITAKNAKLNKKLKMIELQMKKLKMDREAGDSGPDLPTAQGHVLDRNELLRTLLQKEATPPKSS